jgi:hypothetical protein
MGGPGSLGGAGSAGRFGLVPREGPGTWAGLVGRISVGFLTLGRWAFFSTSARGRVRRLVGVGVFGPRVLIKAAGLPVA